MPEREDPGVMSPVSTAAPGMDLLDAVSDVAAVAGERILEIYGSEFDVHRKRDRSPVTAADMAAHHSITGGLAAIRPKLPVLSEESRHTTFSERCVWRRYWLVDPLDGTREFVKRNGEFTVNIALVEDHRPVLGVILVPVTGVCYLAAAGLGAFKREPGTAPRPIRTRRCPDGPLIVAGSRSHLDPATNGFIANLGNPRVMRVGSSLKSCLVAEGEADVYPRFGPTAEWDTAAAQCIVEEAGGGLTDTRLQPLEYNTRHTLLNPDFLVFGDPGADWSRYLPVDKP